MKRLKTLKKTILNPFFAVLMIATLIAVPGVNAQESTNSADIEKLQDENMDYLKQVYKIINDYPAFSYTYSYDNGMVEDVVVTGVESSIDRKRLDVMLFDLKSNQNMLKAHANRIGVFYSVDEQPEYKNGRDELQNKILNNLEYPENAKNWGVEGTVYVKFVVDENGEIPFATTTSDVETSIERYAESLEEQAVEAVKATSGNWEPGEIENVQVASLAIVPITFDFQKDPSLPMLLQ